MPVIITGNNTPTAGGVTYGDGSTYANTVAGSAGGVLYSAGSSAPAFSAAGSSGQVLQTNGTGAPSWVTPAGGLTLGTPVATINSGTSFDFTGIPAGTKQIIISIQDVKRSGTQPPSFKIGDSGGVESAGYAVTGAAIISGTSASESVTSGFIIKSGDASHRFNGSITLTLINATNNTWAATGSWADVQGGPPYNNFFSTAGAKSLTGVLDRVSLTTVSGGDGYTQGEINIAYQ